MLNPMAVDEDMRRAEEGDAATQNSLAPATPSDQEDVRENAQMSHLPWRLASGDMGLSGYLALSRSRLMMRLSTTVDKPHFRSEVGQDGDSSLSCCGSR